MGAYEYQGIVPPVADFKGDPTSSPAPLTVTFTDQSTGTITSWEWDFGDDGTSTVQNPTHIYNDPGLYTVSLTVTGPLGSDTEIKSDYITVVSEYVYVEPGGICDGYTPCYSQIQDGIDSAYDGAVIKIEQ